MYRVRVIYFILILRGQSFSKATLSVTILGEIVYENAEIIIISFY